MQSALEELKRVRDQLNSELSRTGLSITEQDFARFFVSQIESVLKIVSLIDSLDREGKYEELLSEFLNFTFKVNSIYVYFMQPAVSSMLYTSRFRDHIENFLNLLNRTASRFILTIKSHYKELGITNLEFRIGVAPISISISYSESGGEKK